MKSYELIQFKSQILWISNTIQNTNSQKRVLFVCYQIKQFFLKFELQYVIKNEENHIPNMRSKFKNEKSNCWLSISFSVVQIMK